MTQVQFALKLKKNLSLSGAYRLHRHLSRNTVPSIDSIITTWALWDLDTFKNHYAGCDSSFLGIYIGNNRFLAMEIDKVNEIEIEHFNRVCSFIVPCPKDVQEAFNLAEGFLYYRMINRHHFLPT